MGRKSVEQIKKELDKLEEKIRKKTREESARKKNNFHLFRIGSLAKIVNIENEDIETLLGYLSLYSNMDAKEKANCKKLGIQILDDRKAQRILDKHSEKISETQINKIKENPNQDIISKFIKDEFNKKIIEDLSKLELKKLNKMLKAT